MVDISCCFSGYLYSILSPLLRISPFWSMSMRCMLKPSRRRLLVDLQDSSMGLNVFPIK